MWAGGPSVAEIDATAAVPDPVLRNLRITAAYAQLSRAFAAWLPGGANWCTFATWASRQAGTTIRKEDIAHVVADHLRARFAERPVLRHAHRVLGVSVERLSALAGEVTQGLPGVDRASHLVAQGNRKVFEEIGREFARFLGAPPTSLETFLQQLTPGPPPEGQELLRRAFANYQSARAAGDADLAAQLSLLANIQIGLHEQTRLQPEIRGAMDAALLDVADVRRAMVEQLGTVIEAGLLRRVHLREGPRLLNAVADTMAEEVRDVVRIVVTDRMMSIGLPNDRTLRLGSDAAVTFAGPLATLTHPELVALLADYDIGPDTPSGSGAVDWSVLPQRMHFIADFFRAYHTDRTLFDPPFQSAQLQAIAAGRVPPHV